jgi:hypothetical protein
LADEAGRRFQRVINKQSLLFEQSKSTVSRKMQQQQQASTTARSQRKMNEDSVGVFSDLLARKRVTKKELLKRLEEL